MYTLRGKERRTADAIIGPMNSNEVEAKWRAALQWFQAQPMGRRKVELAAAIRPLVERLRAVGDPDALHKLYADPDDLSAAEHSVRAAYPDNPHLWDLSRTRDVAYGLRYSELVGPGRAEE